jgi:hypothetical protein
VKLPTRFSWLKFGRSAVPLAAATLGAALLVAQLARCGPRPGPELEREKLRTETTAEKREERAAASATEHRQATVRHVETRTERRPDGVEVTTRTEDERTAAVVVAGEVNVVHALERGRTELQLERGSTARPRWRVAGAAGWRLDAPELRPQLYGLDVSRRVAGPLWLGAWARTDRTAGISLAVEW